MKNAFGFRKIALASTLTLAALAANAAHAADGLPFGATLLQETALDDVVGDSWTGNCGGSSCWRDYVPASNVWTRFLIVRVESDFPVRIGDTLYVTCDNGNQIGVKLEGETSAPRLEKKVASPCGLRRISKVTLRAGFDGVAEEDDVARVSYIGSIF